MKDLFDLQGRGGSGSEVEWADGKRKMAVRTQVPPAVLEQDTEPLIAPDVQVGALYGFSRHLCMNGWMWCTISAI